MATGQRAGDALADFADLMRDAGDSPHPDDRPPRRVARRVGIGVLVGILILVVATGGYAVWALGAPLAAPTGTILTPPVPTPSTAKFRLPEYG